MDGEVPKVCVRVDVALSYTRLTADYRVGVASRMGSRSVVEGSVGSVPVTPSVREPFVPLVRDSVPLRNFGLSPTS